MVLPFNKSIKSLNGMLTLPKITSITKSRSKLTNSNEKAIEFFIILALCNMLKNLEPDRERWKPSLEVLNQV